MNLKKQFNYLTISFAFGPVIAPFLGGYLQHYFGWQANFVFSFGYAFILLIFIVFVYRETLTEMRSFSPNHLWKNYQIILSNRTFLGGAIFLGLLWGYGAFINVMGPFLVESTLHYSAITYGYVALLIGVGWFSGNLINRFMFSFDNDLKTKIGLWLALLINIIMFLFVQLGYINIYLIVIPTVLIIMLSGVMFPIYVAECLVLFPKLAATANACMFGLVWIIFSLFTLIATLLNVSSLQPLSVVYTTVCVLSIVLYYSLLHRGKSE